MSTTSRREFLQTTTLGLSTLALQPTSVQSPSIIDCHAHCVAADSSSPLPAKRLKRVYLDTGQTGRGPRGITLAATVFGADRILFGTDSGPVATLAPTIASVKHADLTADQKSMILSGNACRLLALKGVS